MDKPKKKYILTWYRKESKYEINTALLQQLGTGFKLDDYEKSLPSEEEIGDIIDDKYIQVSIKNGMTNKIRNVLAQAIAKRIGVLK